MQYVIVFLFGVVSGAFGLYEYEKHIRSLVARLDSQAVAEVRSVKERLDKILTILHV